MYKYRLRGKDKTNKHKTKAKKPRKKQTDTFSIPSGVATSKGNRVLFENCSLSSSLYFMARAMAIS